MLVRQRRLRSDARLRRRRLAATTPPPRDCTQPPQRQAADRGVHASDRRQPQIGARPTTTAARPTTSSRKHGKALADCNAAIKLEPRNCLRLQQPRLAPTRSARSTTRRCRTTPRPSRSTPRFAARLRQPRRRLRQEGRERAGHRRIPARAGDRARQRRRAQRPEAAGREPLIGDCRSSRAPGARTGSHTAPLRCSRLRLQPSRYFT